ncbi:hypothetical protein SUGI_0674860 [Cryptomeria japonica]|nr:hypothetical protein SUGI_0674860 [Cryptomeria japonica]
MASTSGRRESASTNTYGGPAPSPSTSVISSSPFLCSSCFDWVSSFIPWRSDQSNSTASTSAPGRIQQNEVMGAFPVSAPFASTYATDHIPKNEVLGASYKRISPSPAASTTDSKPENEVMGSYHGIAPSASTSASTFMQKLCDDVYINHRGPDVKVTLAISIYNILNSLNVKAFLDSEEFEDGDFIPTTLEAAMKSALVHDKKQHKHRNTEQKTQERNP